METNIAAEVQRRILEDVDNLGFRPETPAEFRLVDYYSQEKDKQSLIVEFEQRHEEERITCNIRYGYNPENDHLILRIIAVGYAHPMHSTTNPKPGVFFANADKKYNAEQILILLKSDVTGVYAKIQHAGFNTPDIKDFEQEVLEGRKGWHLHHYQVRNNNRYDFVAGCQN